MKTVAESYALSFHGSDQSLEDFPNDFIVGQIGANLREFYGDLTESELPHTLLALAQALDARLAGEDRDR